jgi:hypothetical protein
MALSDPRLLFGIHSATFYNRTTRIPYGQLRVLQGSTFSLSGETVTQFGGSLRFPWGVEDGNIETTLSLTFNEYPDFLYELFLGKQPTATTGETTGNVTAITNQNGTSAVNSTTGIASIAAKGSSEADLKFGKYTAIVLSGGTTVDIYASSDVDFARGTDGTAQNDLLKITASPLTIPDSGATVDIPNFGITITGGSGTVSMTEGDTATFEVRPINSKASVAVVGATTDVFPTVGAYLYAQQRGTGDLFELDVYSLKATGLPHNFNAKEFSEAEITMDAFYDSSRGGVFSMRSITI